MELCLFKIIKMHLNLQQTKEITMDCSDVKRLLPHRDPFLFIDKVISVSKMALLLKGMFLQKSLSLKVTSNFPIMPGVIIVEAMAQSCGILGSFIMNQETTKQSVYLLCGIDKSDLETNKAWYTLIFKSKVVSSKRGIWKFESVAYKDDDLVCSAEILCADRSLDE